MSMHKSLVTAGKLKRHRNVLTRAERLDLLLNEERRKEEDSVFGLPKVRNIMMRAKKKKEEAPADAAAAGVEGAVPGAEGAAAPAADAKAAAAPKKEEKKK